MRTARRDTDGQLNPFWPAHPQRKSRDGELDGPCNGKDYRKATPAPSRFRGWAVRLNDRCELWLERFDWRRVDVWFTKLTAVTVTGALLWIAYVVIDAWMQGRFQIGGQ